MNELLHFFWMVESVATLLLVAIVITIEAYILTRVISLPKLPERND